MISANGAGVHTGRRWCHEKDEWQATLRRQVAARSRQYVPRVLLSDTDWPALLTSDGLDAITAHRIQ